jgi:hypothetical protein
MNPSMQSPLNNSNPPVVFMHYGDAPHLKIVLESALLFNPNKDIVLLGDQINKKYERLGIRHFFFSDYGDTEEKKEFNRVFKVVKSPGFRMSDYWIRFVTERFFYLHGFIKRNGLNSFWTFDSDNLILTNLSEQEYKFSSYDFTEQNHGKSMQGFIRNTSALENYLLMINSLFEDSLYVRESTLKFNANAGALTEMDLFLTFKERTNYKSILLSEIINGETFDDHITFSNGVEMTDAYLEGYLPIKKIFYSKSGDIFYRYSKTNSLVKVNSIDMSWTPLYLFDRIFKLARKRKKISSSSNDQLKLLNVSPPLGFNSFQSIKSCLKRIYNQIRN